MLLAVQKSQCTETLDTISWSLELSILSLYFNFRDHILTSHQKQLDQSRDQPMQPTNLTYDQVCDLTQNPCCIEGLIPSHIGNKRGDIHCR
jgi:hypothetical protein